MPGSNLYSEPAFEGLTKFGEHHRQLPVSVDRSVVEGGGPAFQRPQEMKGIEDLLPAPVTASVGGDGCSIADDFHAVDVSLHAHGSERPPTRHAVTVPVEANGLVLVHLAWLNHARIEAMGRHRQCGGTILLEPRGH